MSGTSVGARIEVIKLVYAAFLSNNHASVWHFFSPSFIAYEAHTLPYGGEYHGWAGLHALGQAVSDCWKEMVINVQEYSGNNDAVIGHLKVIATSRKTHRAFTFPVLELWRFNDDRIIELRPFYWDTGAVRECALIGPE